MPLAARQRVPFSCLSKRKEPKRRTSRSHRHPLRFSCRPGASRTRRALNNALRARHRLAIPPGRGCDARRRLRVPTSNQWFASAGINLFRLSELLHYGRTSFAVKTCASPFHPRRLPARNFPFPEILAILGSFPCIPLSFCMPLLSV
jgi:hypothetical protein